ncbi:hypothetical protein QJS04_geneDACA010776 [Acorus gramineus]|uniref:Uncharacterized protein n=1 Tax=Acorus gramineus TaxID=55184 RepID=A0AAV9B972_ACOGR|nr:hypothetical protein QJS04_geneDACA010776 [Acorus gramineus]
MVPVGCGVVWDGVVFLFLIKYREGIDKWDMDSPMVAARQQQRGRRAATLDRSGGCA